MKVALDAQLTVGTATGIGEYVRGLVPALGSLGIDVAALQNRRIDPWRFDRRLLWDQALFPLAARAVNADLMHCASGTMPLFTEFPVVVTVHDVAWLRTQAHARSYARTYFGRFAVSRYRRAAAILVDSEFSRRELLELTDIAAERVVVAYPGVARDFAEIGRAPTEQFVVLAVGTVEPRKNLEVVIRALEGLPEVSLVSVGPSTSYEEHCRAVAREVGAAARVAFLGYVTRERLLTLYASAALAVVPSLYEGFGYGAAQALCAGLPVIVADAASLPEVVTDAAARLPPSDVPSWREAIADALARRRAYEARAANQRPAAIERFSWESCARATARAYESVHGRSRSAG